MRRRTPWILGACLLMLAAAAVTGFVLLRAVREDPGSTWDAYAADGRALVVTKRARSCDDLVLVDVLERPQRVEVTVDVTSGGLFCAADEEQQRLRVRLEEPLGKRVVYDGGCLAQDEPRRRCAREEERRR